MKLRSLPRALFWGLLLLALPLAGQAPAISMAVAAAGDLRGTLEELQAAYEARHRESSLQLSFGASGSLAAQILQGAPFDLFLSADAGFPEQLIQAGLASEDGAFAYATGSLVLWVRRDLNLDPEAVGLKLLLDPRIKHIATANALTAPYGRAGEAALRGAGLLDTVQAKLVFGDNIAQAAQFLHTGAAEAGLISRSQGEHQALKALGRSWILPSGSYPPLKQMGLVLKRSQVKEQVRAFRDFLLGEEGQAILARHGFGRP